MELWKIGTYVGNQSLWQFVNMATVNVHGTLVAIILIPV